jgi:hypothetical protein
VLLIYIKISDKKYAPHWYIEMEIFFFLTLNTLFKDSFDGDGFPMGKGNKLCRGLSDDQSQSYLIILSG